MKAVAVPISIASLIHIGADWRFIYINLRRGIGIYKKSELKFEIHSLFLSYTSLFPTQTHIQNDMEWLSTRKTYEANDNNQHHVQVAHPVQLKW